METNLDYERFNTDNINIHEYYEVEHWTKELNTSVEDLKRAVENVGPSIKDIKIYLKK